MHFNPGGRVQTFIFRDMITPMSDDSSQLDKDSFYTLLTVGYLKNRRRNDPELSLITAEKGIEPLVKADHQKLKFPMVILSAESGFMAGDRFTVTLPCTIGRQDCDLILKDRLVSRRHAEIRIVENKLVIEDLASTNGTRVNGNKITINGLAPNDLISIGPTNLRVSPA